VKFRLAFDTYLLCPCCCINPVLVTLRIFCFVLRRTFLGNPPTPSESDLFFSAGFPFSSRHLRLICCRYGLPSPSNGARALISPGASSRRCFPPRLFTTSDPFFIFGRDLVDLDPPHFAVFCPNSACGLSVPALKKFVWALHRNRPRRSCFPLLHNSFSFKPECSAPSDGCDLVLCKRWTIDSRISVSGGKTRFPPLLLFRDRLHYHFFFIGPFAAPFR